MTAEEIAPLTDAVSAEGVKSISAPPRPSSPLTASPAMAPDVVAMLVAEREILRQQDRLEEAEQVREELNDIGVKVLDKNREWHANDGRRPPINLEISPKPGTRSIPVDNAWSDQSEREESSQPDPPTDGTRPDPAALRLGTSLALAGIGNNVQVFSMFTPRPLGGNSPQSQMTEEAIRSIVVERERLRAAQDFPAADELRERLASMGVVVHDDKRIWKTSDGRQGTIITGGSETQRCALTKTEIHARIARREEARWQKDWERGDQIRDELRREGCELIDNLQCWRTADGRQGFYPNVRGPSLSYQGKGFSEEAAARFIQESLAHLQEQCSLQGAPPMDIFNAAAAAAQAYIASQVVQSPTSLSLPSIEALVAGREAARENRDFRAADAIREDLRSHGVDLWDKQRMWRASDGRRGSTQRGGSGGSRSSTPLVVRPREEMN